MALEDRLYSLLKVYNRSPQPLKYVAGVAYRALPASVRLGREYHRFRALADSEKDWAYGEIESYQLDQINLVLEEAVRRVPFYREQGGYPPRVDSLDEFRQLPTVTKAMVRENPDRFMSDRFNKKDLICFATSGSTGQPLRLNYEKGVVRTKEVAYINSLWNRIGYNPGDKLAQFRSLYVKGREAGKIWEYEPIKNRWIFSSFDVVPKNMPAIVQHLRKVKPAFLYVYPSVLTIVANYMKAKGEPPLEGLKGILSGSENTFPFQIQLFDNVFQVPTHRWYGLSELSALGGGCEKSHHYHCFNTYSYAEILQGSSDSVSAVGDRGQIVGTSFDNLAMPLVRYETGDYGFYAGDGCSHCGRQGLMISEVEGRSQELIVDKRGQTHSLGPYLFGIHEEIWSRISGIQFHQSKVGEIHVRITVNDRSTDVADYVLRTLRPRFDGNFDIDVDVVDELEKTRLGQHRYLLQELETQH